MSSRPGSRGIPAVTRPDPDRAHDGPDAREGGADQKCCLAAAGATEHADPVTLYLRMGEHQVDGGPERLQRQLDEGYGHTVHPEVGEGQHAEAVGGEERSVDLVQATLGATQQQHARMRPAHLGMEQRPDDARCRQRDTLHAIGQPGTGRGGLGRATR